MTGFLRAASEHPNQEHNVPRPDPVLIFAPSVTVDARHIAEVCHEANRAYCRILGDTSHAPWAETPEWKQKLATDGVLFHANNPLAGARASHDNWCSKMYDEGWAYGVTKDSGAKTHPSLVPFAQLPVSEQRKDHLFRAIVHAYLMSGV